MRQREKRDVVWVYGYRELVKANAKAAKEARLFTRHELRKVGDIVREDSQRRFDPVDSKSAAGYKTRVRQRGIAVEQSLKKTTGKRGKYGTMQMKRALLPALYANRERMDREFELAIRRIAAKHERSGNVSG